MEEESKSSEKQLRIYIGGLGATVTTNDLTKTFSAPNLGTVTKVDLIRTKDRSFAYLDFIPCSDKGLAKLFSTYNGCKWKGGSLRLEKAKEHYLQQLRREWEEDSEVLSNFHKEDADGMEDLLHTVKSKKLPDLDKMQLNIFFPRLRKVKAVPYKGTGKHKYSFQRVEPRALPAYFCDCEEHSGAQDDKAHGHHYDTKTKDDSYVDTKIQEDSYDGYDNENGEINEQEVTMMNSVMNKLFEREIFSEANRKCGSSTVTIKNADAIGNLATADDQPEQMNDEDNLIINMVDGSKNNASWLDNNLATSNQDIRLKELHTSKSRHQNLQTSKQKTSIPVGEKRKQLKGDDKRTVSDVAGRKIRKIMPSDKDEKANFSHSKGAQTSDISVSKNLSYGCENSSKPQTNVLETINRRGQLQKSERRSLSAEVDNSTFGISSSAPSGSPGTDFQFGTDILGKPHTPGEDNTISSIQITEPKVSAEGLSGSVKMIADKATKGASWLQKSVWTRLVKGSESSSFSISDILPDRDEKANLSHSKGAQTSNISLSKILSDGCENSSKLQTNVSETINCKPGQLQKCQRRGLSAEVDDAAFGISCSAPSESPGIDFQAGSESLGKPHAHEEDNTNSSVQTREPKVSAEGLSGSGNLIADKATKGASWLQKCSWTQLVKGSESSSFSISQILPQTNFDKQEIQQPTFIDFSRPNLTTHVPLPQLGAHENLVGNTSANIVGNFGDLQADPEKNQIGGQINEASTSSASNKHPLAAKRAGAYADETFAFVRTAASMKEFAKLKASLSGSLKKKGDKKDS